MQINQTELLRALTLLKAVVPATTTMPILTTVLGVVETDRLSLTATNLRAAVTVKIRATGSVDPFLVAFRPWHKIVKAISGVVDLSVQNKIVSLSAGTRTFSLEFPFGQDPDEAWPEDWGDETPERDPDFSLLRRDLVWLLDCRYCCDVHDASGIKSNVLLRSDDKSRWAVATSSSRMDVRQLPPAEPHYSILLPHNNAEILSRACAVAGNRAGDYWIDMPFLYWRCGAVTAKFYLQDATYVDFERILSSRLPEATVVSREQLQKSLKLMESISTLSCHGVTMAADAQTDILTITVQDQNEGLDVQETLPCRSGGLETDVDSSLLHEVLDHHETDDVEIYSREALDPIVVKPHRKPGLFDRETRQHTSIMMPLRI